jgi:hypothetical protein
MIRSPDLSLELHWLDLLKIPIRGEEVPGVEDLLMWRMQQAGVVEREAT